jgi:hypothetical protein
LNGEEFGETQCELRRVGGDVESTVDFLELRLRDRFKETIVILWISICIGGKIILMSKSLTVLRENPSRADNSVSEMTTLPTELIPRDIVCNNGRMTKLMLPTVVKLGAVRVCNAVKLSNSNVPVMVSNPDAVKAVTEEV